MPVDEARAEQIWRIALTRIRETNPSRYPLYVETVASFDEEGKLVVTYRPDQRFRMKQAGERANLAMIGTALREATGNDIAVTLRAGDDIVYAPISAIDTEPAGVATVTPASEGPASAIEDAPEESTIEHAPDDELHAAIEALGATMIEEQPLPKN